jgi:hypothetical protein
MFLPKQEDESELGVDPNRLTDPAREGGCPPTELELPGAIRRIVALNQHSNSALVETEVLRRPESGHYDFVSTPFPAADTRDVTNAAD